MTSEDPPIGSTDPLSGADLISRLQRTLGIAILVESVESVGSDGPAESSESKQAVTIRATFMAGSEARGVVVSGASEAQAWEQLARAAITWRNSDYQHIQMWPGGG